MTLGVYKDVRVKNGQITDDQYKDCQWAQNHLKQISQVKLKHEDYIVRVVYRQYLQFYFHIIFKLQ